MDTGAETSGVRVSAPGASQEELAAIVAAVEEFWPDFTAEVRPPAPPSSWRFSGRWWSDGDHRRRWR